MAQRPALTFQQLGDAALHDHLCLGVGHVHVSLGLLRHQWVHARGRYVVSRPSPLLTKTLAMKSEHRQSAQRRSRHVVNSAYMLACLHFVALSKHQGHVTGCIQQVGHRRSMVVYTYPCTQM